MPLASILASVYCRQFFGLNTDAKRLLASTISLLASIFLLNLKHHFLVVVLLFY